MPLALIPRSKCAPRSKSAPRSASWSLNQAAVAIVALVLSATLPDRLAAQASQQTHNGAIPPVHVLVLGIGDGQLVGLPARAAEVFVADDKIADIHVRSPNQFFVFGKAPGETTLYASDARGAVIWSATVRVGNNLAGIADMLHAALPDADISTTALSGMVLITGTVRAPLDAAEAERLAKAFVGEKVQVISRLRVAAPQQVNLQVRIAEVSRSLVRSIGVNWATSSASSGFKFGIGQGTAYSQYVPGGPLTIGTSSPTTTNTVVPPDTTGTRLVANGALGALDILGTLDMGETIGLVSTLAEPNLTALSGESAEFLAGGEFPIPMSQALGTTTIDYKKYGVSLTYTPTVLANGRIALRVRPEVSELSQQGAVTLNGYSIPGITVRRAETTVELGSGQSFMIAGLLSNSAQNTITKMPGAGDLPILGSLFRSTAFTKGETELVIVVTPYLVQPVDAKDIRLPTDGFRDASALAQVLGMRETAATPAAAATVDPHAKPGFSLP